jgi:hypothetical protein
MVTGGHMEPKVGQGAYQPGREYQVLSAMDAWRSEPTPSKYSVGKWDNSPRKRNVSL